MCSCTCKLFIIIGALVGVALIIIAAVLGFAVLPDIIDDQIYESVVLDNKDSEQFERFEKLPFALNFTIYFFNVTNPNDVMENGAKPIVEELPSIVYKKQFMKQEIEFDDDNKTIKYYERKRHQFSADYSEIGEDAEVTVLNVPLVSVIQIFENLAESSGITLLGPILKKGAPLAFGLNLNEPMTVFHQVQIGQYTFHGYKFCNPKTMAEMAENAKNPKLIVDLPAAKFVCAAIRLLAPESMLVDPETREIAFSFFEQKDDKWDGQHEADQGVNDIKKVGHQISWRGESKTSFWLPADETHETYTCNDIKGTDSTIFPPHNTKDSVFDILNTDICRTVQLAYTEEIDYQGVPGYRSVLKRDTMNGSLPENQCFCTLKSRNLEGKLECLPDGFLDMYSCLNAPIVLSLPHFLWADDTPYAQTVEGLQAIEEEHKIYVDMEPNTGSPLVGHKRIQFNMILRRYNVDEIMPETVKPAVIPIMWIDENVQIPENLVDKIKNDYLIPVQAIDISRWVLIGVGIVIFIGNVGLYIWKR